MKTKEEIDKSIEDRFWLGKYPPEDAMKHYNNCEGCFQCENLLGTFGHCSCCAVLINKDDLHYDHPTGDYYCDDCVGAMPENNTVNHAVCGGCYKRFYKKNMVKDHENFYTTWACNKCVYESVVNNRFELLDL